MVNQHWVQIKREREEMSLYICRFLFECAKANHPRECLHSFALFLFFGSWIWTIEQEFPMFWIDGTSNFSTPRRNVKRKWVIIGERDASILSYGGRPCREKMENDASPIFHTKPYRRLGYNVPYIVKGLELK